MKIHERLLFFGFILLTAACQTAVSEPTETALPTVTATATVTLTATPTAIPPSETPTPSPTATDTPTITPTATLTPIPSLTPEATVGFVFDNWALLNIPSNLLNNLNSPMVVFINQNDRDNVPSGGTPQPATGIETLYYVPPTSSAGRVAVLQLPAATGNQIFISANGQSIAYFLADPTNQATGLYIVDLINQISGRILPIRSLVQRGIPSEPNWTADGERLAIALATGYDMDIFSIGRDGTSLQNLTQNGAYDWSPVWSPDGRYLAFLSERANCPSRIPGESDICSADTPPPFAGNIFILDTTSGRVGMLSSEIVSETPRWINSSEITFASGDPTLGSPPERRLWIGNAETLVVTEVKLADGSDNSIRLSEAWSPDGSSVVYHSVSNSAAEVIAIRRDGSLIGRTSELNFPRFGMSASWSNDGSRIAIGGVNGQCPYGARVLNASFDFVTRGNPPPGMCNPVFSNNGQWLAFTGVNPRVDGRVDVLVANNNGSSAVNLTSALRGTITFLGWVGG
ncbi:MAG: PD40 domain-containing protein [Anaerolineae bacterium]|nr:PD40 domain-containing protein [Anaerolineae bacterium]